MYNNEDRTWMYDKISSDGQNLNFHFELGVDKFLEHAFDQLDLVEGGKVRCPCMRCCNSKFQNLDTIKTHLCSKGFVSQYYVWTAHGECSSNFVPPVTYNVGQSSGHATTGRYRDMVDDMFGGRFENVNYNHAVNEDPNEDAKAFSEMLRASEEPIGDVVSTTMLEWMSKFMANKTLHNISTAACNKMIQLVKSVMRPEDRSKIPDNVYGMKRLLKGLGLRHKTFDVCVNYCILYYGEFESSSCNSCPHCGEDRYEAQRNTNSRAKRISRKKLWYFPLTLRLQRLYMSRNTAEHMTWHLKCQGDNDSMIHPAAGAAWKSFDATYPDYATDARNVRLALSTDGFTHWGNSATPYSCWPVFVIPYNLPPDMCMRQEYIFLSLLISGPKSPGKNIDVMLRPLINELRSLWDSGVQTYDSFRKEFFLMRAHVMWTISDFPVYGMLSQWSTHDKLSCPYCMGNTKSFWLQFGRKHSFFDCHRRFLPLDHPWRMNTTDFKIGVVENDAPLHRKSGAEMKSHVDSLILDLETNVETLLKILV